MLVGVNGSKNDHALKSYYCLHACLTMEDKTIFYTFLYATHAVVCSKNKCIIYFGQ